MTQSIIEKLECLTVYYDDQMQCLTVKEDDLRAIIEQTKAEKQEPSMDLIEAVGIILEGFSLPSDVRKILETAYYDKSTPSTSPPPPQPDIVAELVKALEDIIYSAKYFPSNAKRLGDIAESAIARAKAMTE